MKQLNREVQFDLVIDASFLLKLLLVDDQQLPSKFSRFWQNKIKNSQVVVPDLFYLEVANVLATQVRLDRISPKDATRLLNLINDFGFQVQPTAQFITEIFAFATNFSISVYDASYVYLAFTLDVPLFTEDKKLAKQLSSELDMDIFTFADLVKKE